MGKHEMKTIKRSIGKKDKSSKEKRKKENGCHIRKLKKMPQVDYDGLCKWMSDLVDGKNPACPPTAGEMAEDMEGYSCVQADPDEDKLPIEGEVVNLYDMPAPLEVMEDQQWSDLTDAGYKLAATGKHMAGETELTGPLSIYFSSGAAAMKEKLKGSDADFNEAVKDILSGMVVDNLVHSQSANMVMMSLETPFSPEYMKMLKTRHQLENQVLKIIETKQRLTAIPIRIRNAAQVNVGQVQQVVNHGDDREGG